MDAKLFSNKTFNLSGTLLLSILAAVLSVAAIIFDWMAGNSSNPGGSLAIPMLFCAVAVAALGYWVVPMLQWLKTGQVIREDGPKRHLKKAGTPTMGGIFFIPVGLLAAVVWSGFSGEAIAACALTLAYATIGWLDDWQILRRKSNKGISPKMKLALLIGFGLLFCLWLALTGGENITSIALPFGLTLPLGFMFWPLAGFVLVAQSNSTNLTDGLDGLMGGTGAIAFLGLGAIVASTSIPLAIFCACMSGSCLGFLAHNRNPARVFMGDTGSLALGGALAAVALLSNSLWSLFIISGIFFVEAVSVMAQVGYYKATKGPDGIGKRLLKMAPMHHHLELSGWSEITIVAVFYSINCLLVWLAFLLR
ncbi:MAG: phospho-N-acetylmuramoyl-pentapeptide-transferase [Oscillatoria sp. SIO1A7]|nr:phospho-N-acetylmuramoyl-pentapeptide-transferase [Oscillatoria sp. SIO1A7]